MCCFSSFPSQPKFCIHVLKCLIFLSSFFFFWDYERNGAKVNNQPQLICSLLFEIVSCFFAVLRIIVVVVVKVLVGLWHITQL